MWFDHLLRSLRHRRFRTYYLGQLISLNGTWMQTVAQAWLVYRLTESSFLLGLTAFLSLAPVLVFGLVGGMVADRWPRQRLFLGAQWVAAAQAVTLGTLVVLGHVQVWQIMGLALLLGFVHAFEMPARHSFVAELVPKADLSNAVALNSSAVHVARFVGPALSGWLVARFGEGPVFYVNAVSFLVVILAVHRLTRNLAHQLVPPASRRALGEGFRFAWGHGTIRGVMALVAMVSLVGSSYAVLMPVFAREVFGGDARTLGMLLGLAGAGALTATLRLAVRRGQRGLRRNIGRAALGAGAALLLFSAADRFWLGALVIPAAGFCFATLVSSANVLLQMAVPDELRGRLMALFSVVFIGLTPVGNLLAGSLAHFIGAPWTVALFGTCCVLGAVVFLYFPGGPERGRSEGQ